MDLQAPSRKKKSVLWRMTVPTFALCILVHGAFAQNSQPAPPVFLSPAPPVAATQNPDSKPKRLRVGGNVMMASLTRQPMPIYPSEAKKQHIEGTVVLHAVIAKDGTISQLQYISGPPMLMKAAMDAVRQWEYKPTILNGEPTEVDTTISIVFTFGGSPPSDSKGADLPANEEALLPSTENQPPPMHPGAARAVQAPYPDTPEGMKAQMEAALKAGAAKDNSHFDETLDSFAIENPTAWLTQSFGQDAGGKLVKDYETSLSKFKEHIKMISGFWQGSATSYLLVESSLVPKPPEGDEDSKPPRPVVALNIEDFRFQVRTGGVDPGDWVFSFVYVDGAFRIVGGTFAFWDDNWNRQKNELAIQRLQTAREVNRGIQGVEVLCPGDGLVRVFVSPKAQAESIKERVDPVYPENARKAGIEGTVLFHAIIGVDGSVKELELEDGDPALAKAAEDAVMKWKYKPTTYYENTEGRARPAEVDTAIAVQFKLPQ